MSDFKGPMKRAVFNGAGAGYAGGGAIAVLHLPAPMRTLYRANFFAVGFDRPPHGWTTRQALDLAWYDRFPRA